MVFGLAVGGGACGRQTTRGGDPESGEGRAEGGVDGYGHHQGVRARRQGGVGEDLLTGVGPVAVGVEVDPGVEDSRR